MSLLGIEWDKESQSLALGYQVTVWRSPVNPYLVRVAITVSGGEENGKKRERVFSGETSQHDADRWINDIVGYPNPFYGLVEYGGSMEGMRMWQEDLIAQDRHRDLRAMEVEHRKFLVENDFYSGKVPFYPSR